MVKVLIDGPSAKSRVAEPILLALSNPNLYRFCFESEVTNHDLNSKHRRRVQPFSCCGVPRFRSLAVAEQPRLGLYKRASKKGGITP